MVVVTFSFSFFSHFTFLTWPCRSLPRPDSHCSLVTLLERMGEPRSFWFQFGGQSLLQKPPWTRFREKTKTKRLLSLDFLAPHGNCVLCPLVKQSFLRVVLTSNLLLLLVLKLYTTNKGTYYKEFMINTSSSHTTFRRVWTNHFSFIIIPRLVGLDHFYVISGMRGEGICNQPGKRFQIILSLNFTLFSLLSFSVSFPIHTHTETVAKKKQTNKI